MNDVRKEKLRIANLVCEINERGFAVLTFDLGSPDGIPVSVHEFNARGVLVRAWYAMGCKLRLTLLEELQGISRDLRELYRKGVIEAARKEALTERKEMVA